MYDVLPPDPTPTFTITPVLKINNLNIPIKNTLIDSGASACFIDYNFVKRYNITRRKKTSPSVVRVIDGREVQSGKVTEITSPLRLYIGKHCEKIEFNIIRSPTYPIVLGMTWLKQHNPDIDWKGNKLALRCDCGMNDNGLQNDVLLPLLSERILSSDDTVAFSPLTVVGVSGDSDKVREVPSENFPNNGNLTNFPETACQHREQATEYYPRSAESAGRVDIAEIMEKLSLKNSMCEDFKESLKNSEKIRSEHPTGTSSLQAQEKSFSPPPPATTSSPVKTTNTCNIQSVPRNSQVRFVDQSSASFNRTPVTTKARKFSRSTYAAPSDSSDEYDFLMESARSLPPPLGNKLPRSNLFAPFSEFSRSYSHSVPSQTGPDKRVSDYASSDPAYLHYSKPRIRNTTDFSEPVYSQPDSKNPESFCLQSDNVRVALDKT